MRTQLRTLKSQNGGLSEARWCGSIRVERERPLLVEGGSAASLSLKLERGGGVSCGGDYQKHVLCVGLGKYVDGTLR